MNEVFRENTKAIKALTKSILQLHERIVKLENKSNGEVMGKQERDEKINSFRRNYG